MPHLLLPQVETARQHPCFQALVAQRKFRSARLLLQDAFERMPVRDGGFIKDFQSTEFDTRQFEVFTSELLHEAGAVFAVHGEQPDFEPSIGGVEFAVECVTVNPTKIGDGAAVAYRPVNRRDADIDDLRDRLMNDVPTRFGGALHSKRARRFKPGDRAYWELDHVAGKPLVFAVQTFHEDGALAFSGAAISRYLYGIVHKPSWDESGNLVIEQTKAPPHRKPNGTLIPSGFFDYEGAEHIAAVLWSNTGTIPKFLRMALQGPYPDDAVRGFRSGSAGNPDPNAHAPAAFLYEVGDPEWPETWGEGCILFHNPRALHPLPVDVMTNVSNAFIDEQGRYVENVPAGLHPFMSLSFFGATPEEHESAARVATEHYEAFNETNRQSAGTGARTWWDGFKTDGAVTSYRSDALLGEAEPAQPVSLKPSSTVAAPGEPLDR
jgi:hypothetical protein